MSELLQQAREGKPLDIDIVDMHTHLGRSAFAIPDLSPESRIDSMDRLGISVCLCSSIHAWSPDTDRGNARILEAMEAYPERILGYVVVFPSDPEKVQQSVERWLAKGFTGLKFHDTNGFPYADAAYEPAYAIAHERRLPILLHTWGEESQLTDIRSVAERYGDAAFITAHSGSENEEAYVEIANDLANVYLGLAYSAAPRGLVARLVEAVGAEKLIWGSDSYFYNQAEQLGKVIGADIPDEAKLQILAGNARRLLERVRRD